MAVNQSNRRSILLIYIDYFSCRRRDYSQSYSLSGACPVMPPNDARLNEKAKLCGGFDQVCALTARAVDPGRYRVVRERWRFQRPRLRWPGFHWSPLLAMCPGGMPLCGREAASSPCVAYIPSASVETWRPLPYRGCTVCALGKYVA